MSPDPKTPKAVFLDRDGTLNHLVFYDSSQEWESPRITADLRLLEGAAAALRAIRVAGWALFLVSNQPSHAKGKVSLESLQDVHSAFERLMGEQGVRFHKAYYCYHHPEGIVSGFSGSCPCRKPSPHFLRKAAREFGVDLNQSWMVGDQDLDIACGRNAGCRTILIPYPHSAAKRGHEHPDLTLDSLAQVLPAISSSVTQPFKEFPCP